MFKKSISTFIMLLILFTLATLPAGAAEQKEFDWSASDEVLKHISDPVFPDYKVSVLDFGAVPDGKTLCTDAFKAAIEDVNKKGGGTVVVPKGVYLTGAIHLLSNVNLYLEDKDTIIKFTQEANEKNYPLVLTRFEGSQCYNYSPFIYAYKQKNVAITGKGTLDGQADKDHWWNWKSGSNGQNVLQDAGRNLLMKWNDSRTPVEKRVLGDGYYLRPNFIQPYECTNVLIEGIKIVNSPMWEIHPVLSTNVTVRGVYINSSGPNNDGCDPECCNYVLIENCSFNTGDDCIAIKAGRNADGRELGIPCQNIVIRNNTFAMGHGGIAIGSEMSGGVRNVFADNNHFDSPDLTYALRFKTNAQRGGVIENIYLRNSNIKNVDQAVVHGTMLYEEGKNGNYLPTFRNIVIENITSNGGEYGIFLEAFDEVPIKGLVFRNININNVATPLRAMNWVDPVFENVTINGMSFPRPIEARIEGVPQAGNPLTATCLYLGGKDSDIKYSWFASASKDGTYTVVANTKTYTPGADMTGKYLKITASDPSGNVAESIPYKVLTASSFKDIKGQWYEPYVRRIAAKNLVDESENFNPNANITRIEVARMLAKLWGLTAPKKDVSISDMTPGTPDYNLVAAVVEKNMMKLVKGAFNPNGIITREEMASIAMNSCGVSYKNASNGTPTYADKDDVSSSYKTDVARSRYIGLMEGVGNNMFMPKNVVTRDQAAAVMARVSDYAGK